MLVSIIVSAELKINAEKNKLPININIPPINDKTNGKKGLSSII
jgi:hypothetical protein